MKAGKCFNIGRAGSWTSFGSIAPILSVLSASMAGERTVGELCDAKATRVKGVAE